MYKYVLYVICAAFILSGIAGCGGNDKDVLARIDDRIITEDMFENRIDALPDRYKEVVRENKRKFLDEVIIDELLYTQAIDLGLDKDEEVGRVFEEAKKKILISKFLQIKIDNEVTVDDAVLEEHYASNKEEFRKPEIRRASHILVRNEQDANEIAKELAGGRNFEDLARSKSVDPTAQRGGDIGYFARGQLEPNFENVCFVLEPGQISEIVKTRFGYHIIKLTEINPPEIAGFEEVKDVIHKKLLNVEKKKKFNDLVTKMKDRAKIEINEDSSLFKNDVAGDNNGTADNDA